MIDEQHIIQNLQQRIDEYLLKYPKEKDSEKVTTIREFIHILKLEAKEN
jgi:hypothetical protein